jgi:CTP synthase
MKSDSKTRVIILFGGVYSSLGKGIVISSIGKILSCLGKKVSILKFDPYLNVDPENMSPNQHGEVYVCKDGAQTDLDLGNYERFIGCELTQMSNITSGRIYNEIIKKERDGKYNGKTVQVIPHVVNMINSKIYSIIEKEKPNFLLIEVGGTIGDAESIPFVEAISQFIIEYKKENVLSCLLCPLINLSATSNELKTKPTQHSIRQLRSMGIDPNFLILRTNTKIDENVIEKLHTTSHIDKKNIFISPNLNSIYDLPDILYKQQMHLTILNFFSIAYNKNNDNFEKK